MMRRVDSSLASRRHGGPVCRALFAVAVGALSLAGCTGATYGPVAGAEGPASTSSRTTSASPAPSTASAPTGKAELRGQVVRREKLLNPGSAQVILTDLSTGRSQQVPAPDGAYRVELAPGSYAASINSPGDVFLPTSSDSGGRCDDLITVGPGEQKTVDLSYPCRLAGEPTSVAQTLRAARVAAGLEAPSPTHLEHTDEFGEITDATVRPDGSLRVQVDRVDWLFGARAMATNNGVGPPADVLSVNQNPKLRAYTISPDAQVWGSLSLPPLGVEATRASFAALQDFLVDGERQPSSYALWHLQVEDDVVTGVEEQYHP